jgi:hypothetical protein
MDYIMTFMYVYAMCFRFIYPTRLFLEPSFPLVLSQIVFCLFLFLDLHSQYERKHVIFVYLFDFSLNVTVPRSIHFPANSLISSFYMLYMSTYTTLCTYTAFSLSVHPLMGSKAGSIAWLLWIVPKWTWVYRYHYYMLTLIPLGTYPGSVKQDDNGNSLMSFLKNFRTNFNSSWINLHSHK